MGDLVDRLIDLLTDPLYWLNSLPAIITLWLLSLLFGWLMRQWNRILQFFEPTDEPGDPPRNEGPSSFEKFMGCAFSTFLFVLLFSGVAFYLWWEFIG
jgi:hypothetical protein